MMFYLLMLLLVCFLIVDSVISFYINKDLDVYKDDLKSMVLRALMKADSKMDYLESRIGDLEDRLKKHLKPRRPARTRKKKSEPERAEDIKSINL